MYFLLIARKISHAHVLPKISDQAAYYSRQLYIYNFAVVKSVPENTLNRNNVTLYTWTEDEHRKGANEIASAVYNTLQTTGLNENAKLFDWWQMDAAPRTKTA